MIIMNQVLLKNIETIINESFTKKNNPYFTNTSKNFFQLSILILCIIVLISSNFLSFCNSFIFSDTLGIILVLNLIFLFLDLNL